VALVANIGLAINNRGQVVGGSALPGNTTQHAFLWTREKGMRDLGKLQGDVNSVGLGINDSSQVAGGSFDKDGNPRAFLWNGGVMSDLNMLIPAGSPLFLLCATAINSSGEIAGFGVTGTGDIHAYLATPHTSASAGPKNASVTARQITLDGSASASADGSPLTYSWSIPYGSPSASILQGNTATPSVQFSGGRGCLFVSAGCNGCVRSVFNRHRDNQLPRKLKHIPSTRRNYCSFANSALACSRPGISGSASFLARGRFQGTSIRCFQVLAAMPR